MSAKIDGALERVGPLGRYQVFQQFLAGLGNIISSFHFIAIIFFSITPDMRIPGWDNDTYTAHSIEHNDTLSRWIPLDKDGDIEKCKIYNGNVGTNMTREQLECNSFVYSHDEYWGVTLNERFGLVCSSAWIGTTIKVTFTAGLAVGAVVFGFIGDRIGRRYAVITGMLIGGVCSSIASFSVNIYMFAVFRFLTAVCFVGVILISHCISMEITGPSKRSYIMMIKTIFWPTGTCLLSLIAYLIQDWNWFQLAISVPPVLAGLLMVWLLNETPHYLVVKGKHDEAVELFHEIARQNGRNSPDNLIDTLKEDEKEATREKTKDLLRAPVLLKRTLIFFYLWFISGLGFYGLSFNVGNLSGNVYINSVISGSVEYLAIFMIWVSKFVGRKKPVVLCLAIGSLSLISCAVMYVYLDIQVYSTYIVAVAMIGKFSVSTLFGFSYFWSSEVFPTTLRTSLVGLCSLFARIGSLLSPVIVDMYIYLNTPFKAGIGALIFGITMFIGGILSLYLPETNNEKIPETIAEANQFMTSKSPRDETPEKLHELELREDKDEIVTSDSKADLVT